MMIDLRIIDCILKQKELLREVYEECNDLVTLVDIEDSAEVITLPYGLLNNKEEIDDILCGCNIKAQIHYFRDGGKRIAIDGLHYGFSFDRVNEYFNIEEIS